MANPSMDREPDAWLRELLEQAYPALLRGWLSEREHRAGCQ